jgi:hypothetical protein
MNMAKKVLFLTLALFGALTAMVGWSIGTAFSALLTAIALVLVRDGLRSESRLRSLLTIAWLYWGLSYASNLVEAVYFAVLPSRAAGISAVVGLIMALVVSGLLELLTARESAASEPQREPQTALAAGVAWRIPVLAFAFFAIYLAAGVAIQPWIASFYAHRHLPTLTQLLLLQLGRGAFDLACIYPVFLQWKASRGRAVWMSAYGFTVLCGWGPLLLPNQFLPGPIRLAHAVEMGASGVAFGALAALVLLQSSQAFAKKRGSFVVTDRVFP